MPSPVDGAARFQLPARIRLKHVPVSSIDCQLGLADRIAGLPGISTFEHPDDSLPSAVSVYLGETVGLTRKRTTSVLLCRISREGIEICGLSDWERHQVLRSGWGRLRNEQVLVHLPRDADELETCWRVIARAHTALKADFCNAGRARAASPWELPRFSRTSLQ